MKRLMVGLWLFCVSAPAVVEPAETLRVVTDATFAPFHYIDDEGQVTGFDIELARAVAEEAGYRIQLLVLPYDQLFSGIVAGSHDLVAATTGITPERETRFLFSNAYFETCQAAVVRTGFGEPRHVIELAEKRIGASGSGTSMTAMQETLAAAYIRIPEGEGESMLLSRSVDAWIVDEFDAVAIARASHGELAVLPEPVRAERYGFVMARDRVDLKKRLDASLAKLLANGTVDEMKRNFRIRRDAEWPVRY